jgi:flagellar biosynthesis/type III secretory pathway protein FliH
MSDELKILRQQNEHLRLALDRLKGSDLYQEGYDEGHQEGIEEGEREAAKSFGWDTERIDELEDLIADFFRGVADVEDLRRAVA